MARYPALRSSRRSYDRNKAASAGGLFRARRTFDQIASSMDSLTERYDVLLSPITAGQTPWLGDFTLDQPFGSYICKGMGVAAFAMVANVSGQSSMSVPGGFVADDMSAGMLFTAALCREDILLWLAGQLERERPWPMPAAGWESSVTVREPAHMH